MPQVKSAAQPRVGAPTGYGNQQRGSRQSVAGVTAKKTADRPAPGMTSGSASFGGNNRTVTTERVPRNDENSFRRQSSLPAKGVTVGSNQMTEEPEGSDGYEELF